MSRIKCSQCCFYDVCGSDGVCSHFAPLDDELDDNVIEDMIEAGRKRYEIEYMAYIKSFYEDIF